MANDSKMATVSPTFHSEKPKLEDNFESNRSKLPVFQGREEIVRACRSHCTVILVGETGSGKTTQLPQLLLQDRVFGGRIAVTQPRRVAAISVAGRVALEHGCRLGSKVGYTVRFDDKTSKATQLRYLTDGMLLREAMLDNTLKRYSVIILDEAHERSLHTDILFGIVKRAQRKRKNTRYRLRIIVMSATLDVNMFMKYFEPEDIPKDSMVPTEKHEFGASYERPIAIHVHGRQFPVKVLYASLPQADYVDAVVVTVLQIHLKEKTRKGDILVFLTGQEEIEACAELLEEKARRLPAEAFKLIICPIFAALPAAQQMRVFEPTPNETRKVILATNIAETSITVSGVRHVVDPGLVKVKSYRPATGLELLEKIPISQAQAWQRTGRAGREAPGKCYRLFTEGEFHKLQNRAVPEIQRIELSEVVLQLLYMNLEIQGVKDFEFLQPPDDNALHSAHVNLLALGAIDLRTKKLTDLGKKMASLPLHPAHSKFLIESIKFGCTEEVLTIAAMLSVESPFFTPRSARDKASAAHARFSSEHGDHITLLNLYKSFKETGGDKDWCNNNFVKLTTLIKARKIRSQLRRLVVSAIVADKNKKVEKGTKKTDPKKYNEPLPSCSPEVEPILKCLVSSFALQVARRVPRMDLSDDENEMDSENKKRKRRKMGWKKNRKPEYKTIKEGIEVGIHPSSSIFRKQPKPEWVCFNELILTSKKYLRGVSEIKEKWLVELAPMLYSTKQVIDQVEKKRKMAELKKKAAINKQLMCD